MSEKASYREWLQNDLGALVDEIKELTDVQKHSLRSRWLNQVAWMEGKAVAAQRWYYILRLTTIIGGVIVPALVTLKVGGGAAEGGTGTILNTGFTGWLTVVISLLVAISAAIDEFFHFGERWRHYRRTVELLKIEGWQFLQLGGPYRSEKSHLEVYPAFAARVEEILQQEVEVYITQVVRERERKGDDKKPEPTVNQK
jgi:hypothetical protein